MRRTSSEPISVSVRSAAIRDAANCARSIGNTPDQGFDGATARPIASTGTSAPQYAKTLDSAAGPQAPGSPGTNGTPAIRWLDPGWESREAEPAQPKTISERMSAATHPLTHGDGSHPITSNGSFTVRSRALRLFRDDDAVAGDLEQDDHQDRDHQQADDQTQTAVAAGLHAVQLQHGLMHLRVR